MSHNVFKHGGDPHYTFGMVYMFGMAYKFGMLQTLNQLRFGSHHVKARLRAYADSEGPDQAVHPRSLIRTVTVR